MGVLARLTLARNFYPHTNQPAARSFVAAVLLAFGTGLANASPAATIYSFFQDATISGTAGSFPIQHSGELIVRSDTVGRVLSCAGRSNQPQVVVRRQQRVITVNSNGALCGFQVSRQLTIVGAKAKFVGDEFSTYRVRSDGRQQDVIIASEEVNSDDTSGAQRVSGVALIRGRFEEHVRFDVHQVDGVVRSVVVAMHYCGREPLKDSFTLPDARATGPTLDPDDLLVLIVSALPLESTAKCPTSP